MIKIWARLALQFYCSEIVFDTKQLIAGRPTILAANHPNSFLDAIIIGAHHPEKVHFLARGDAFNKPFVAKILRRMNLIPIYRLAEGKENLSNNELSFVECLEIFKLNGSVLIFSEGLSVHEWSLRSLKKGTARLAYLAWYKNNIEQLAIQPIGLTYNSFTKLPKSLQAQYGKPLTKEIFTLKNEAIFYNDLNIILSKHIEQSMILKQTEGNIISAVGKKKKRLSLILLAVPALLGYISHRWFYVLWRNMVRKKTAGTVFYDSVLFGSLMFTYPIVVLLTTMIIVVATGKSWLWSLMILLPFIVWCYKEYRAQEAK